MSKYGSTPNLNTAPTNAGEHWGYNTEALFSNSNVRFVHFENKGFGDDYAQYWDEPEYSDILQKTLAGKVLVDLGGGDDREGTSMLRVIQNQRVALDWYINIDKHARGWSFGKEADEKTPEKIAISSIRGDLLESVMRIEGNAPGVAFALNGVDRFLIPGKAFHEALACEIDRVVSPGNVVLTKGSEDTTDEWESDSYRFGMRRAPGFENASSMFSPVLWIKEAK